MEYSNNELSRRMKLIIREVKALPTDSKKIDLNAAPSMREVPYWNEILKQIEGKHGSLARFYERFIPKDFIESQKVEFPSPEQDEATTQMLEKSRLLIRDKAGAGKTAPAIKAKLALEQLVLDGGKVNAVVVCPNFVLSSWQAKLREYHESSPNVLTITSAGREFSSDVFEEGIKDGSLDYTLVSYDALFRMMEEGDRDNIVGEVRGAAGRVGRILEERMDLADKLVNSLCESENPFLLVLDESQNAKNPNALRSKAVKKMGLSADYLYALTGNPFTDNLEDIGELASLLDSDNYKSAEAFNKAYEKNPRLIRLFLRRFSKEPVIRLEDISEVPAVHYHPTTWLDMSEDEQNLSFGILDHRELSMGSKLALLRLAAVDSNLLLPENYRGKHLSDKLDEFFKVNPELLEVAERVESTKYEALDSLVRDVVDRGDNIVIWTKLREGITRGLVERYDEFGALRIDGTIDSEPGRNRYSERDIARLTYQTNPDARVLVATIDSLREGQDVHKGNVVAFMMRDFSPGPNDQTVGRVARRGQLKEVDVHSFLMRGTIEEGIFELEEHKREGIMEAEGGYEMSTEQKQALDKGKADIKKIDRKYLMNAGSRIRLLSGMMINKGADSNTRFLEEENNALIYAQSYNYMWNYSYSAHTARLISQLVGEVEKKEGVSLEKIIDLGSGPATVSRTIQRPSMCVDINPFQLEIGKRECERLGVDISTLIGNVESLDEFSTGFFDLGVMSLVLHYGNFENGGRKRMVLEMNRVMKDEGYGIITLPHSIVEGDGRQMLEDGLYKLGLEPVTSRTGLVHAVDGIERDYRVYATVVRKIHENPASSYEDDRLNSYFILNPDFQYVDLGRKKAGAEGDGNGVRQGYRKEVCSAFEFESGDILNGNGVREEAPRIVVPKAKSPKEIASIIDQMMRRDK